MLRRVCGFAQFISYIEYTSILVSLIVKFKTSVIKNGFQCNRCKTKLLRDVVVYGTIKRAEVPGEQDVVLCPKCGHAAGIHLRTERKPA